MSDKEDEPLQGSDVVENSETPREDPVGDDDEDDVEEPILDFGSDDDDDDGDDAPAGSQDKNNKESSVGQEEEDEDEEYKRLSAAVFGDGDALSGGDGDGEEKQKKKKKTIKKKRKSLDDNSGQSEEDDDEEPRRKRKKRKEKKERKKKKRRRGEEGPSHEEDEEELELELEDGDVEAEPEDDLSRRSSSSSSSRRSSSSSSSQQLSELDVVMKQMTHRRKQNPVSEEQMKESCEQLVTSMEDAYEADKIAYKNGKPAVNRLKLLPTVKTALNKVYLHRTLLQSRILSVFKDWLEPAAPGGLPHHTIRTDVLQMIWQLGDISENLLSSSQIGGAIMYLNCHKDEVNSNKILANKLIQRWSRPIFQLETQYVKKAPLPNFNAKPKQRSTPTKDAFDNFWEQKIEDSRKSKNNFSFRASIPRPLQFDFVRQPEKREIQAARAQSNEKRLQISKKFQLLKSAAKPGKVKRALKISVEGRGLGN